MNDEQIHSPGRIIGIDFGMKRIGIAISDETRTIAMPLTTVTAERKSEHTVLKVIDELRKACNDRGYVIEEIVIGMPLRLNGKSSFLGDEVKHFSELLSGQISYPITLWDERLTTAQAERALREANLSRKKRSKVVDTVAATIILQSYLDKKLKF